MPDAVKFSADSAAVPDAIFSENLIYLNAAPKTSDEAIRAVGQVLVDAGAVEASYTESMLKRETLADTWLGNGIAIPHGMVEDKHYVRKDSVAVLQVPNGVTWSNGERAFLIFGIAARGDGHLAILRRLTRLLQHPESLQKLFTTTDKGVIGSVLSDAHTKPDTESSNAPQKAAEDFSVSETWILDYPAGLHARPSSAWIAAAKQAGIALRVRNGSHSSDITNLVSLLQLGAKCGDSLVFSAEGDGAERKLHDFLQQVKSLSRDEKEQARKAEEQRAQALAGSWQPPSGAKPIVGVAAAPGLAIGTLYLPSKALGAEDVEDTPLPPEKGAVLLQKALTAARMQLQAMSDDVARRIGAHDAAIFKAQADLLDDDSLLTQACRFMLAGHGVAKAWILATEAAAQTLAQGDNPLLKGRAADLHDVGRRVLGHIDSRYAQDTGVAPVMQGNEKYIIAADDLSPSDTANLNKDHICGLATFSGGPTSHTAILARTMGLPAMVAGGEALKAAAKNGVRAIINGNTGVLWLNPQANDIAAAEVEIAKIIAEKQSQDAQSRLPALTPDGKKIVVAANVNTPDQAEFAMQQGADGVGLMRTEFLFLERADAPDEQEQYEIYRAMCKSVGKNSVIIRALDIGGDKQVPYLHLPQEENPFLGVRGARLLLRRPDLLYPQMRALFRAAKDGGDNLSVMFPMIMSVSEVARLKEIAENIRRELNAPPVPLGIMVEVPSAAICADKLAKYVDFFSVGTNDLTQYVLAADRQSPALAAQADGLHPAVLRMIAKTIEGAALYKRFVGVCGGLAADPFGALLLAGLGVDELSMTPSDIASVKAKLRATPFAQMQDLARQACNLETAAEVRALEKKPADTVNTHRNISPDTETSLKPATAENSGVGR